MGSGFVVAGVAGELGLAIVGVSDRAVDGLDVLGVLDGLGSIGARMLLLLGTRGATVLGRMLGAVDADDGITRAGELVEGVDVVDVLVVVVVVVVVVVAVVVAVVVVVVVVVTRSSVVDVEDAEL